VEIGVTSRVPNTQAMYILVDKNPNWLAAGFSFPQGTEPSITTRIKMNQTANVIALIRANNQFFMTSREVRVVTGGCVS
jgi:sulfur-oxidizing protein SoxY